MNPIQTACSRTLVKEADYNRKISEVEKKKLDYDHSNKYFSSQEINKFTSDNFAVRLKQSDVATKADINHFIEKADFHEKQKVELISTKRFKNDLINGLSILDNSAKYFFHVYYKIIWYMYQLINTLSFLVAPKKFIHVYLKECQKKVLKIFLNPPTILLQL